MAGMLFLSVGLLLAISLAATEGEKLVWKSDSQKQRWEKVAEELRSSDSFTLLSIDPAAGKRTTSASKFEGYPVLGALLITNSTTRDSLIDKLAASAAAGRGMAKCFIPRHGIQAIKGTNTIRLVICFECRQMLCSAGSNTFFLPLTKEPATFFNQMLLDAGVPLAK